jgi:uncharacterized protein (TIGR03437 family)
VIQFGTNLPFLFYGDVGRNAWGWRGFATNGFIPAQGFVDVRRVVSNPVTGRPGLVFSADIDAQNPACSSGAASTEPAVSMPVACPRIPAGTLLNLEGVMVRARLCFPAGSAGPDHAPNTFQFTFASQVGNVSASLLSPPVNIDPVWEGRAADLDFRVSSTGPGEFSGTFDATRVSSAGLKITANPSAGGFRIQGDFILESLLFETTPPLVYDFAEPLLERHFRATRALSIRLNPAPPLIRVFTLVDGRAGIVWSEDGPQGLDSFVFRDFDALVDAAERTQVELLPVLLDFNWSRRAKIAGGVQIGGRSYVIRDAALRQKFVANIVEPILTRYGNHPSIRAWEIMNEPEWVVSGIPGYQPDPQKYDVVALADMREFFRSCIEAVRRQTRHDVTIGSAHRSWVSLWKDTGVTVHSWHYYDSDASEPFPWRPKEQLQLVGPVFVTEVPTAQTQQAPGDYLRATRQGGYDALCLWSCRAQDVFSDFPAATVDLVSRIPQLYSVSNAASYGYPAVLAPELLVALFGANLAPASLDGVMVTVEDSSSKLHEARILFVSPDQVNCLMPWGVSTGRAILTMSRVDGGFASLDVQVNPVAPGLFTANGDGKGVAAAFLTRVAHGQVVRTEPLYRCDATGRNCQPVPFRFGPEGEDAFLILYATGLRARPGSVIVRVADRDLSPIYAGPQNQYDGLDQVNTLLPRGLAASGLIELKLVVDGLSSNSGSIHIE